MLELVDLRLQFLFYLCERISHSLAIKLIKKNDAEPGLAELRLLSL
jgi:hypothetical protein